MERPIVVLGHGASGTAESMRPHVDGLRARGVEARAIDLPKRKAEEAVEVFRSEAGIGGLARTVWPDRSIVIGGHSYGGRVASLLAATSAPVAGLVLLSYPLHRPGQPEWETRTVHWATIRCPVIFLSGEADPFARIDLLRAAVAARLPEAELVTYPRLGHGLLPVLDDMLDRIGAFVGAISRR